MNDMRNRHETFAVGLMKCVQDEICVVRFDLFKRCLLQSKQHKYKYFFFALVSLLCSCFSFSWTGDLTWAGSFTAPCWMDNISHRWETEKATNYLLKSQIVYVKVLLLPAIRTSHAHNISIYCIIQLRHILQNVNYYFNSTWIKYPSNGTWKLCNVFVLMRM